MPVLGWAQARQPLVPSLRNDRRMAAEAARRAAEQQESAPAADTPDDNAVSAAVSEQKPVVLSDSAVWAPVQPEQIGAESYESLMRPRSGLDLQTPSNITTEVEYQPATGYYIIHTKIGDVDIATPYLMNGQEYSAYSEQQQMHRYWQQKIGEVEHNNEKKFDITDMKFNIGPADKVFGPGGVQLKMQGSAELLFGFKHQYIANPSLTERSRNNNIFDFDEKIQVSVNGKVGEKLNFNMSYNTEASFAFDQQNLKLAYKGQEDDIIQSIEAGNVTMDLNSSLIRGSQALFGIKTNLKFGKLKIQALVSQQNSESQTVSSKGGAQMTRFEVPGDAYDENRHFFLGYFFRDKYEDAMQTVPYIASGVTINKIEVWVTNKRGNYDQARNIIAFADLAEENAHISNPNWTSAVQIVPDNKTNDLYDDIRQLPNVRDIQQTSSVLQDYKQLEGGDDFEKVESARLLSSSEYTLNAALGYISLKSALNQDEVLAVAYEYTYAGKVYQVGEFSTDANEDLRAPNALILKLLKSTSNAPSRKNRGTWDLMMKNIYSLGATSISSDKFELYVSYRNDSIGTEVQYLTEGAIKGKQLLRVMNLDRLDSKNNSYPDGKFDYIEGLTVYSSNGRIIFPVLEPFGSHLRKAIANDAIADKYVFQELYDSTLVMAQELSEKNKFYLTGKFKGTSGSEIRLNAMNVPRGSVTVTAGGATLIENVDYTVDYTMGTVTILNQSILESGTNVDVKLENQSTFSMQRKSLFGAHLEYEFTPDLVIGGTIMHLRERPLTTKVNSGSEPLANTIWGVNGSWKTDIQWLTNAIDKIPWITATQPSTFQINAEFAHLIPGHTRDVGSVGTAYIDDFESTTTNIDVHYPSYWFLASTPSPFEESKRSNDIEYGKNRALLAWYAVDPIFGYPQRNTPQHIRDDVSAMSDHRTRIVYEQEIYPNKDQVANEDTKLSVLNLSFYPEERGPYNIVADEVGTDGKLTNPEKRWGGMMRKLDNTDFEKSNIEYIEFWLMDPALTNPDGYEGEMYINLGDISEDILRDGKKSFEHGLPISDQDAGRIDSTAWGRVPKTTSTVTAFSNETGARARQDVGLNGLSTADEYLFTYNGRRPYQEYIDALRAKLQPDVIAAYEADPFSPFNDPAGDNYHYYRGSDYDDQEMPTLQRYKHYNGTEGNSPDTESQTESYGTASTLQPDIEDINGDNTLSEYEKYYQYRVLLRPDMMEVGRQHITEKKVAKVNLRDGSTQDVTWYQFKIPLRGDSADVKTVGSIRNFKSIRFMRIYLTGCKHETHLRLATLDLVRGEWRNYTKDLYPLGAAVNTGAQMDMQAVNIEENSTRTPINYVLPPGISRQTDPGQAQLIAQNEQAMVLRVSNLSPKDARAVYKNTGYDMRNYKKLQMFVHAEQMTADPDLKDGDLSCFVRLGTDLKNNYYEYEIPLRLTPAGLYNNDNENDRMQVWPADNMFDFPFSVLTDAKVARNKAKRAGNTDVGNTVPYVVYDDQSGKPQNKITVLGNPTLEDVECIMIGIRNTGTHEATGEVWVNELRLSEFNEQGGVAAMANAALSVSDIAQLNVAGRLETAGYGSIESNVLDRNMDNIYQISVSAALEAGRLFPEKAKIQMPLYVSYSNETLSPDYDPLDTDIKLKDNLDTYETKEERDSIRQMSNTVQESTSFSVTNMKVNIKSKKRDMFYDPANFSISASYNKQNEHTPEMERNVTTDHKGSFNYAYSFNPKPWEPFKNVQKVSKIKFLKELNFYYLPQSLAFSTNMHRTFSHMKMRDLSSESINNMDLTFSKDFTWDRNFDFKYDLTKNMKFSFQSAMNATIDEGYYAPEILRDYAFTNDYYEAWRDTIQRSLAKWGSPYTYQQVFTASWNVPFNRIPYLEALSANASYNATYNWARTAQSTSTETDLGNTVSSLQSWQVDGGINFETLYGKSKYWKQITQLYSRRQSNRRPFKPKTYTETVQAEKGKTIEIAHRLNSETLLVVTTDTAGRRVPVSFKPAGNTKVSITPKADCEAMVVTITTKDPNTRTPAQVAGDMFAYVGTMFRRVQVTYRRTNSMTVPGFSPEAGFMGQRKTNGLYAPGFDFAFGFIPSDFVSKAKENGWLSGDTSVVQPATRAYTSDFDIKLTLEPLPGLKIQVNGKRYMANSTSIIYSYDRLQENMTGSFNITQVAIGSAFARVGSQEENFANATYDRFVENLDIFRQRVQSQYDGVLYPTTGFMAGKLPGGQAYNAANGAVARNSADVLVPAFLSAYTGRNANTMSLNPFLGILKILPNWSVTYDGLGKLPWMRDHFRSVTLTHAYTCKYSIGSFGSYSTWVPLDGQNDKMVGFVRDVATDMPIPSSAYDIANVSLTEAFSPLIGLNMSMNNSLSCKFEYRKQRNLALNVTSVQLTEGHTNEFVIGAGYTIKNLNFITKKKDGRQKRVSNDLKLNVDVSYKDIKTLLRKVEENITQASSGNKVFAIKISADYVLSQKINLQLFYDHQGTTPLISSSYPVKSDNVGINIKLMLTR
ncbi:MAG: cell surface protein SprA [Paludibacteraceae bacterium]